MNNHIINITMLITLIVASVILGVFVDRIWLYYHEGNGVDNEVISQWLDDDDTDSLKFTDKFKCLGFSEVMVENAIADNLDASVVILRYDPGTDHAVVAFKVKCDYLFIEPQSDKLVGYMKTSKEGLTDIEIRGD